MDKSHLSAMGKQLLEDGVAWRHVKRFLREISDHCDDLHERCRAEGLDEEVCKEQTARLMGEQQVLVAAMIGSRELQSLGSRFPVLLPAVSPLLLYLFLFVASLFLFLAFTELAEPRANREVGAVLSACVSFCCFFLMHILSPLLAVWILVYSIRNRLSLKPAIAGVMLMTALSCAVQIHLRLPEPLSGTQGMVGISLGYGFASGFESSFESMDSRLRLLATWVLLAVFFFIYRRRWQGVLS